MSSQTSTIGFLATEIATQAKVLEEYFESSQTPKPSFDSAGPSTVLPNEAPGFAHDARAALADAAFKLFQLAMGPSELMSTVRSNYQTAFALHWLFHFKIFSFIPLDGIVSYDDVAAAAQVPVSQLKSVVRMAVASCVFAEPKPGMIQHNAFSIMFAKNPEVIDGNNFTFEVAIPTAAKMVEATEQWPDSVQSNQTAHNLAFGHGLSTFEYMSQDEARMRQFSNFARSSSDGASMDPMHLVRGFDWSSLGEEALVVDVGGSSGYCSWAVADAFPKLRFEVQDLPSMERVATQFLDSRDQKISSRISFRAHDFFQEQPAHGADAYLLRMILHDWPDAEAISILNCISRAMSHQSRIIIMDTVLPEPGEIALTAERALRYRDLAMKQHFNAKERSMDEWLDIIHRANPCLEVQEMNRPPSSEMAVMVLSFERRSGES